MKKGIAKHISFCLALGLTVTQAGTAAMASGLDTALVGLCSTVSTKDVPQETKTASSPAQTLTGITVENTEDVQEAQPAQEEIADTAVAAEEVQESTSEGEQVLALSDDHIDAQSVEDGSEGLDTSMVGTTGFAQCEEYLNVRTDASADSEAIGKIYHNNALEILDVAPNGWYQVRSGNVEGYVSPDYVAVGEQAEEIASNTGYTTAQVSTDVLNVRADASTDADIIATVDGNAEIEVVEEGSDWVKVILDGEMYGYVSADYVSTNTEYATGETYEEEQARLDQQWLDYLAEQEAQQAAAEAAYLAELEAQSAYTDSSYYDDSSYYTDDSSSYSETYDNSGYSTSYTAPTVNTSGSADELASQAQTLYDSYLSAQEAADAAVANGSDEQTVMDTAAAAQAAYGTYVEAQNAADAAAAGMNVDTSVTADDGYNETYTEDQTYTEEQPYQEEVAQAPAATSAGQAIADFACQFVGNPYVYGGASLTNGADCSGFTMAVMANFGIGLPHEAAAQSGCGSAVSLDSIQPGDLLFYDGGGGIGHVSIYIGNGQVVHASNPTNGILISSIDYRTPVAARRFV